MFALSTRSLRYLDEVHDDLARVARRAITESRVDFGIICGIRTIEDQYNLVEKKLSTTLHSLHLPQHDGLSWAIDVVAYVNNKQNWSNKYYGPIVQAFITSASALDVQLEYGHLWKDFIDSGHIQLNGKKYGAR